MNGRTLDRLVLAVPKARPATAPSRFAATLLRALVAQHYSA